MHLWLPSTGRSNDFILLLIRILVVSVFCELIDPNGVRMLDVVHLFAHCNKLTISLFSLLFNSSALLLLLLLLLIVKFNFAFLCYSVVII